MTRATQRCFFAAPKKRDLQMTEMRIFDKLLKSRPFSHYFGGDNIALLRVVQCLSQKPNFIPYALLSRFSEFTIFPFKSSRPPQLREMLFAAILCQFYQIFGNNVDIYDQIWCISQKSSLPKKVTHYISQLCCFRCLDMG